MAVLSDYVSGTISLTNGSVDFTGSGTAWLLAGFKEGDTIFDIAGATQFMGVIASISANGAGKLTRPWEGPTLVNVPYRMRYQSDGSRASAQARSLVELLGNGNLQAEALIDGTGGNWLSYFTGAGTKARTAFGSAARSLLGLPAAADKVPYYTGANTAALTDLTATGRAIIGGANVNAVRDILGLLSATPVTDWNTITVAGDYCSTNPATDANSPTAGSGWYVGSFRRFVTGYGVLIVHEAIAGNASNSQSYYRVRNANGTWSAWERVRITQAELDGRYATLNLANTFTQVQTVSVAAAGTWPVHLVTPNRGLRVSQSQAGGTGGIAVYFEVNTTTAVGSIVLNASSTTYATTSDYRAKFDVEPLVTFSLDEETFALLGPALSRVMLLNPVRHKWTADPEGPATHGFIAHEAQAIVPHAVTGEKDAVEDIGTAVLPARVVVPAYTIPGAVLVQADPENGIEEVRAPDVDVPEVVEPEQVIEGIPEADAPMGSTWTKTGTRPVYQGIDTSKLVADLTAALQELTLKVLSLEGRIAELEQGT